MRRSARAWACIWALAAVVGLLALGAGPSAVAQPAAAVALAPADRGAYLDRVDAEMGRWRLKMDGMAEKAKAMDQAAATAAEAELADAWRHVEARATTLKTATDAEWSEARSAFEQASQDLARAWDKTRL